MAVERELNIIIASQDRNAGMAEGNFQVRTVNYTGETVEVKI